MVLMTLDSVFLSELHLAEKVKGEVGDFKSSRLLLLIINSINVAIMGDQSAQEPLLGMIKRDPLSYLTALVNEILLEVGELTYRTVRRNS